ncbi:cytochrome C biogenesis protein [Salmonella enterica]|nr:cytochrome C biogenesis protein [Salmonella enterica]
MSAAIFSAFIGGIILNVMPCVFPVISLKALGLLRHNGDLRRSRLEGAGFLLGVTVTMLLLVTMLLIIRAGGHAAGWGFQLQSPLVIALLALVMLLVALNLLGVFEVGLSLQRAGELDMGRGDFVRSVLTGALAIIVATPCSAPFMASATGYALVQSTSVAMAVFLSLALGFAAPFTLLSFFPVLVKYLPRPGNWMVTVRHVLAFPVFGAYAWLIWVFTQQAGSSSFARLLWSSVLLAFVAWLYGIAQKRYLTGRKYGLLYSLTVLILVGGLAPLPGLVMPDVKDESRSGGDIVPVLWSPQAVKDIRGNGKAIFVNFTASWCITCQVNDKTSLSSSAVKAVMRRTGTVYMIADSTKFNPDVEDALEKSGHGGLPMYLVYPADGGDPVVLPPVLTPEIVVDAIEKSS